MEIHGILMVMRFKQCQKPPMTGIFLSTYQHGDDWGMVYDCLDHIITIIVKLRSTGIYSTSNPTNNLLQKIIQPLVNIEKTSEHLEHHHSSWVWQSPWYPHAWSLYRTRSSDANPMDPMRTTPRATMNPMTFQETTVESNQIPCSSHAKSKKSKKSHKNHLKIRSSGLKVPNIPLKNLQKIMKIIIFSSFPIKFHRKSSSFPMKFHRNLTFSRHFPAIFPAASRLVLRGLQASLASLGQACEGRAALAQRSAGPFDGEQFTSASNCRD